MDMENNNQILRTIVSLFINESTILLFMTSMNPQHDFMIVSQLHDRRLPLYFNRVQIYRK